MKQIYFFIGTEAELIKVFPVIIECQGGGAVCHIIASGQNDLKKSRILQYIQLNGKILELSREENIVKSAKGLLYWFLKTKKCAIQLIKKEFGDLHGKYLIVHGDTVSTMMGAMIGRKLGMQVCHVEAGLRSHHLFNPFPEEIDRLITSKIARMHFAPGEEPVKNLRYAKGEVVNTQYNTILDSLTFSHDIPVMTKELDKILGQDYFVFVMHRQENLMNVEFVRDVVGKVKQYAKKKKCVVILHKITENTFRAMGILEELKQNEQFVLLPRVDYFDFMKLLQRSQFVITDGGSNQEELHYMGKPCLIMRKTTERNEGIGENAVLFKGDLNFVDTFAKKYKKYEKSMYSEMDSPSKIIANVLLH